MKVIYVIGGCTVGKGGIGRTAGSAISGLVKHGVLTQLIVSDAPEGVFGNAHITNIPSHIPGLRHLIGEANANYLQDSLFGWGAARRLGDGDIVHTWSGMSLPVLKKAKHQGMTTILDRASGHLAVVQDIMADEYRRWGLRPPITNSFNLTRNIKEYDEADYIFTPQGFAYDTFISLGYPAHKVRAVQFGINQDYASGDKTVEIDDPLNAVFVGRVGFGKGILYALQAWQEADIRKGKFFVVGAADKDIRPFLKKFEDDPSIVFTGYADPKTYYPRSHVFIFPSLHEGSALVTYEAMAWGLPVITTHNAGSVVTDHEDGVLVSIQAVDPIVQTLEQLDNDRKLLAEYGSNAYKNVKEYTWDQYGEQVVQHYNSIIT